MQVEVSQKRKRTTPALTWRLVRYIDKHIRYVCIYIIKGGGGGNEAMNIESSKKKERKKQQPIEKRRLDGWMDGYMEERK